MTYMSGITYLFISDTQIYPQNAILSYHFLHWFHYICTSIKS